jgi:putative ABC transport system permease protein
MKQHDPVTPPEWPLKLLRFFVKKEYLEEIEGDMEEVFRDNVEQLSLRKARAMYTLEMMKLLRPALVKNLRAFENLNQYPMFKNYFKVSLRGLMKNPLNSFINVFGLAVAIGLCVFAYGFARWTFSTDQFHEHKHQVHLVTFFANRDGTLQQHGKTPVPLGEMLREDFTHVQKVCRIDDRNAVMKFEDNVFHERVRFTDAEFLEMFTFPLKWGSAKSLADANSIILSEDMAIKYFGEENPVGKDILMIFGKDNSKPFKVTGVARAFPKARTFSFNFLINFENLRTADTAFDPHDWNAFVSATLIQVHKPADLTFIASGMDKYRKLQNEKVETDWAISSFAFEPLATLHVEAEHIANNFSRSARDNYISIVFMVIIAAFMLLLACFNYINISIVSATKRLKEIGVRKSIGATRRIVIVQFLTENVVITFFALIIGLILGATFFIRGFEQLWHFDMDFRLDDAALWIFLPSILLLTSIASGMYPALYISKFQVVGILKGAVKFGHKNPLTKFFLGFQLILACIFITCSVMFTENTMYLGKRPWGYNKDETLYASVPDRAAYEQLHALMSREADVVSISGSAHHLGKNHAATILHFPDREIEVDQLSVDASYFETMGLSLKEGRVFNDHEGSDRQAVLVNEVLVKNMGWQEAVGQHFMIDTIQYEVIGVLNEFHHYSFGVAIRPIIFTVADESGFRFLSMRVRGGAEIKAYKTMQAKWSALFPEIPFAGGLQEDVWGSYYQELNIYDLVWKVFAFLAVSLAMLGLYGLIRLNVAGRTKEFSIRKVLGAGLKNIAANITGQYVFLFAFAVIVGAPAGHMLSKMIIQFAYAYHKPITFQSVAIAVVIMITIVLATVATQIRKVLKANPVDGLKVE